MIYSCKIEKGAVFLNGVKQPIGQSSSENWTKELYLELGLNYPKFYKMDDLSKMAILSFTILKNTVDFLETADVVSGMVKGAVFGFIVALIGCYHGMNSGRGAQGVGRATKSAVVLASVLILAANYILTEVFFTS